MAVAKVLRPRELDGFAQLLRVPSSIFTRLTTSANPFFAIGNFSVDQFSALAQTKTGFKPIIDPIKTLVDILRKKDVVENFKAIGGERQTLAAMHDLAPEEISRKLTGGLTKKEKTIEFIDSKLSILELPSNLSEIMTRASEYKRALSQGKNMSEAMYMASEITVPFQLQGRSFGRFGQEYVRSIPYFNAMLQVMYKFGRSVKDNPERIATVGAGIMASAITMAIWIMKTASDDEKRQLSEIHVRDLARSIYIPTGG